jgi:hypothetical protein
MKICLSTTEWLGDDLGIEEASELVSNYPLYRNQEGIIEHLTAKVEHLIDVIQSILTPEQIVAILRKRGYPNAAICDLDEDECKPD